MRRHCDVPYGPPRFVPVPWGVMRQSDLQPKGDPETFVEFSHMRIVGLVVVADDLPLPDRPSWAEGPIGGLSHAVISIRAEETDEPGGRITLAITNQLPVDYVPVQAQSHPRRQGDGDDGDQA